MALDRKTVLVCSCEASMPLDEGALARACQGAALSSHRQLCRAELARFQKALGGAGEAGLLVGCTQEAPLFGDLAAEAGYEGPLAFANLRETAGWSDEAAAAGPKMAALLAAAAEPLPETAFVTLESQGVLLIYGRDEVAVVAGRRLAPHLDVTVLLRRADEIAPLAVAEFPVLRGRVRNAAGYLGAFSLTVDDYAQPAPSSRGALSFGAPRDGATSECDILLDLSGGEPLFPAGDLRPGYLKADPGDPLAVERALFEAAQLTGTFDRPRYVTFTDSLCAHGRNKKTGCTRCLELCPTGAITPAGNQVAIDPNICAGCGACAAVCPTGAAVYAMPPPDALLRRIRALLLTYAAAGGAAPVLLLHDGEHGQPLLDALARQGGGLPARVLPLAVNEVTQVGLEILAGAVAYGAVAVALLTRARARHDDSGLLRTLDFANRILEAQGLGGDLCRQLALDDPDQLASALSALPRAPGVAAPSSFLPLDSGRGLLRLVLTVLQDLAPRQPEVIELPAKAPFGRVLVDTAGCTLCLACVATCPTHALGDQAEKPTLTFDEALCVQCGLCQATCPERVITLEPRLALAAWAAPAVVLKQEEPFHCITCGKPFGTRSTIERIAAKLEGQHWMYSGGNAKRIAVVKMCPDCRVEAVMNEDFDPHGAPARPKPRTTEDYLRERAERGDEDPLN